jgi:hypothetical protein
MTRATLLCSTLVGTLTKSVGSLGPMQPRVAGILLAAGEGSCLGQQKALVEIAGPVRASSP